MKTIYSILALAITCTLPAAAGNKDKDKDNENQIQRDMVLEKDYDPHVETAGKIWSMPDIEAFKPQKTGILFSTTSNLLHQTGDASTLKVAEGTVNLPDQYQKGYLRLGGGNHLHFIGDGVFNLVCNGNQWLDIALTHRSEQRGTEDKKWNSDNRIGINYAANTGRLSFEAALSEEFCNWHYYGSLNAITPYVSTHYINGTVIQMPESQWSSNTGLHLQMTSRPSDKNWDYGVSLDETWFVLNQVYGYNGSTGKGPNELDSDLKAYLIGHINDEWQARLDIRGRYLYTNNAPVEHASGNAYPDLPGNNLWFEIVPQVGYKWHLWSFFAGARFSQLTGGDYKFRVAPEISASSPLWKNASLKIVVNGGERAFSYAEGFRENLYIDPTTRLLPEYTPIHIGAELKWRPAELLQLIPYAGYRLVKDMAMFYNAPLYNDNGTEILPFRLSNLSFSTLYANVNHFYAGLEATLDWCEKVRATADFSYNGWNASSVSGSSKSDILKSNMEEVDNLLKNHGGKVWYKPSLELNARIDVNAVRNLSLSVTYQMQLQRYAAVSSYDDIAAHSTQSNLAFARIDDIYLLGAEASYRITHNIGVFVQADNLLNRTSASWNRYEMNGITVAGGATFTF